MRKYYYWVIASIIFTYSLIFIGGLVRVSGAGLGCPDWPKCFDRWIPPTSIDQVPSYIDTNLFNFRLAWTEYLNRLFGMLTGIVVSITLYQAYKNRLSDSSLYKIIFFVFILTCLEGMLGGLVVSSLLEPLIVSLHLVLAFIIISLLIYVFQRLYIKINNISYQKISHQKRSIRLLYFSWILIVVEILLGTQMREGIELILREFPSVEMSSVFSILGIFKYIHTGIGFLLFVIIYKLYKRTFNFLQNPLLYKIVQIIYYTVLIQIILGEFMVFFNFTASVRLIHMWLSSIVLGLVTLIIAHIRVSKVELSDAI